MRWCLSEQGLKSAGPLLSASLPRIPTHLCQGQNKGILAGPAAVALPAQEEVEAYEEHEEETRAFVCFQQAVHEGSWEQMPDWNAGPLQQGQSLGCSPSPTGGGTGLRTGLGPQELHAAGIPCSFIPQALTECLRCAMHGVSAVDSAPKRDE